MSKTMRGQKLVVRKDTVRELSREEAARVKGALGSAWLISGNGGCGNSSEICKRGG